LEFSMSRKNNARRAIPLMQHFELISFAGPDELARAVAGAWLDEIAAANRAVQPQSVALSGGRIALKFFAEVAKQAKARAVSPGLIHFFWADERCVPPDDPESNFKPAHELLFVPLKIGATQIHRIHGENPPEVAAQKAAAEISRIAPVNENGQPVLDLIFLGLGEDGHVASLFPNETDGAISDQAIFRAIKNSPKPPPNRVTLGYAALAAARQVWVLASGAGKETALRESIFENGKTPLARVIQSRSQTKIFSDFRFD
jgi:6-phosphogluconolactonase